MLKARGMEGGLLDSVTADESANGGSTSMMDSSLLSKTVLQLMDGRHTTLEIFMRHFVSTAPWRSFREGMQTVLGVLGSLNLVAVTQPDRYCDAHGKRGLGLPAVHRKGAARDRGGFAAGPPPVGGGPDRRKPGLNDWALRKLYQTNHSGKLNTALWKEGRSESRQYLRGLNNLGWSKCPEVVLDAMADIVLDAAEQHCSGSSASSPACGDAAYATLATLIETEMFCEPAAGSSGKKEGRKAAKPKGVAIVFRPERCHVRQLSCPLRSHVLNMETNLSSIYFY